MALRIVQIILPQGKELTGLEDQQIVESWTIDLLSGGTLLEILLDGDYAEGFLDYIDSQLGAGNDYRAILLPVEASLPRIKDSTRETRAEVTDGEQDAATLRVSREELYHDITDSIRVTKVYHTLVVLSTIVAAAGMLQDSVAVVIGAMVIAPLIGPNIAMAFATSLGDAELFRKSFRVNFEGLVLALAVSVAVGLFVDVSDGYHEVSSRTRVTLGDLGLALAAGAAGAISITRGVSAALIGVMVAVALLPPLVAFGLLIGGGQWALAYGAMLLLLTNITSINLAAVVTFLVQGIRPKRWYEAQTARHATRVAMLMWSVLLLILLTAILLAPGIGD